MDLTIIIVNWNTRDMLLACLQSIREFHDGFRLQTIVVDNDSSDGSRDAVERGFPEVELINSGGNLGFGRANNVALARVESPRICYLNPDTELRPGALKAMMEVLDRQPEVGGVGCRLIDAAGNTQALGLQAFPTPWREFVRLAIYSEKLGRRFPGWFRWADAHRSGYLLKIYGACLIVRKEITDKIGAFDDRYFMYCEDVDLCRRIIEAGWKLYYVGDPPILHHGAGASSKAPGAFAILMTCQSISQYMEKYYGTVGAIAHRFLVLLAAILRSGTVWTLILLRRMTGRAPATSLEHSAKRFRFLFRWALGLQKATIAKSRPPATPAAVAASPR
ncbi:MAG: glycosyltransferase family 2 protein [Verrucomicrobiales bacterium]|nr:glycosyltransferase family 2 protein [Verrucomicrobiales bacterium]